MRREYGRSAGLLRRLEPAHKHRPGNRRESGLLRHWHRHCRQGGGARGLELSAQEEIASGLMGVERVVGVVQRRCDLAGRKQQQQRGPGG